MPQFSQTSLQKLKHCHPTLQQLCQTVIRIYDFTIISGCRNEDQQNLLFNKGKTLLQYPDSKHNQYPSLAVDIAPYPIDWHDKRRFFYLAGLMMSEAYRQHIPLRWGGDWNQNQQFDDQHLIDLPHFELVGDHYAS